MQQRVVGRHEVEAGLERRQRGVGLAVAHFQARQRLGGAEIGVGRGAGVVLVVDNEMQCAAGDVVAPGDDRDQALLIGVEDREPGRALQIVDAQQRLVDAARADIGPGHQLTQQQRVEVAGIDHVEFGDRGVEGALRQGIDAERDPRDLAGLGHVTQL